MRSLLFKIASIGAALGSSLKVIWSLKTPDQPLTASQVAFLTIAAGLGMLAVTLEIQDYLKSRPKRYSKDKQIRDHMYKLIKNGGNVSVFTRDLSWANDDQMIEMMKDKAKQDSLTVVLPKPVPISDELKDLGATVIYYGNHYTIKSRFTISNMNRVDSTVSIGRQSNGKHIIEKYENKDGHLAFSLAQDLAGVLRSDGS